MLAQFLSATILMGSVWLGAEDVHNHSHAEAATAEEQSEVSRRLMLQRAGDGDAEAVAWLAKEIISISCADHENTTQILSAVNKVGEHPQIIQALVEKMSEPGSSFYYTNQDAVAVDKPSWDVMYPPLQWDISIALSKVVKDANAPDMKLFQMSDHEWVTEQWRTWWHKRREQQLNELDQKQLLELAQHGDSIAIHHMATRVERGDLEKPVAVNLFRELAENTQLDERAKLAARSALVRLSDEPSRDWFIAELQALAWDDVEREYLLLDAIRPIGPEPHIVATLANMMVQPKADQYRVQSRHDVASPRDYMIARTLAGIMNTPTAPKLQDMKAALQKEAVKSWKTWLIEQKILEEGK